MSRHVFLGEKVESPQINLHISENNKPILTQESSMADSGSSVWEQARAQMALAERKIKIRKFTWIINSWVRQDTCVREEP